MPQPDTDIDLDAIRYRVDLVSGGTPNSGA